MLVLSGLLAVSLAGIARAAPAGTTSTTAAPSPSCTTMVLPIKASAENTVYPPYPNSTAKGTYEKYVSEVNSLNSSSLPTKLMSGTYGISATYCQPSYAVKGRESTIQVYVHALGSTKEYFSGSGFPHPDFEGQYSWVSHARSQGYATLAIDRLGNGDSDKPDPVDAGQAPIQLAVIVEILNQLRQGSLPHITQGFSKIILAGHSYGAIMSQLIAILYPENTVDAYILTGISTNLTGIGPAITDFDAVSAKFTDPSFAHLPDGYVSVSKSGYRDTVYGLNGEFDPRFLAWDEAKPHVFPISEALGGTPPALSSNFTGPVFSVVGQHDQIACGNGNILSEVPNCGVGRGSAADSWRPLFPKSSNFASYSPPKTAHFIDNHYSAPEVFGAIHEWLEGVGF